MILSCWEDEYSCLDTLNINICPLLLQLAAKVEGAKILETDRQTDRITNYRGLSNPYTAGTQRVEQ